MRLPKTLFFRTPPTSITAIFVQHMIILYFSNLLSSQSALFVAMADRDRPN